MEAENVRSMIFCEGAILALLAGRGEFGIYRRVFLPFSYVLMIFSLFEKIALNGFFVLGAVLINSVLLVILVFLFWEGR